MAKQRRLEELAVNGHCCGAASTAQVGACARWRALPIKNNGCCLRDEQGWGQEALPLLGSAETDGELGVKGSEVRDRTAEIRKVGQRCTARQGASTKHHTCKQRPRHTLECDQ